MRLMRWPFCNVVCLTSGHAVRSSCSHVDITVLCCASNEPIDRLAGGKAGRRSDWQAKGWTGVRVCRGSWPVREGRCCQAEQISRHADTGCHACLPTLRLSVGRASRTRSQAVAKTLSVASDLEQAGLWRPSGRNPAAGYKKTGHDAQILAEAAAMKI